MTTNITCQCGKRKKPNFDLCYECKAIADGKARCPQCKKGFYDASQFDQCYNCNTTGEGDTPGTDIQRLLVDGLNRLAARVKVLEVDMETLKPTHDPDEKKEELLLDF